MSTNRLIELNGHTRSQHDKDWEAYLEYLAETRSQKWADLAREEGPPHFEEGTEAKVFGLEGKVVCRITHINERKGKFILRTTEADQNLNSCYRKGEIVMCKGAEFVLMEVKRNKMIMRPCPPKQPDHQQNEEDRIYQLVVNNPINNRPFLAILGGDEEEVRANTTLMNRTFDVIRGLASGKFDDTDLAREADELTEAMGLNREAPSADQVIDDLGDQEQQAGEAAQGGDSPNDG